MINFNGQIKKRNINLADRHSVTFGTNYLAKSKLERQKREDQRLKDKSSALIKQYVVRYLQARNQAEIKYEQWYKAKINNQYDFNAWVADLTFMVKYKLPFTTDHTISKLLQIITVNVEQWQLSPTTNRIIIKALIRVIQLKQTNRQVVDSCLQLINIVIDKCQFPIKYPNVIDTLATIEESQMARDIIVKLNVSDSASSFLKYLVRYPFMGPEHLPMLRKVLSDQEIPGIIDEFTELQKVSLLSLFLKSHGSEKFTVDDYAVIGNILSVFFFSVVLRDDDAMEDDSDDELEKSHDLVVPLSLGAPLKTLYDKSFIENMMDLSTGQNDIQSRLAMSIISSLFHVLPDYKTRICITITIAPGSYKWFFNQLKNDPLYISFKNGLSQDYLRYEDIMEIYSSLTHLQVNMFWKTLGTFEELYSYWLIVANDLETFSDDKLDVNEVSDFLVFLRVLCLTLIFNSSNSSRGSIYDEFDKLKNISITLLNQLYLRNLRRNFLEPEFWKIHKLGFNIDSMLQIIGQQQQEDGEDHVIRKSIESVSTADTVAKLEVLNKLPFFIKFNDRVQIFQSLVDLDKDNSMDYSWMYGSRKLHAEIRREHMLEDAFENYGSAGPQLKNKIGVTFLDKWGQTEAGIDGGGITKEFLTSLVTEAFTPGGKFSLFKETTANQLYPNEEIYMKVAKRIDLDEQKENLDYLRFLGTIVGKCLYESVLIDVSFAPFFLNKWCTSKNVVKNSINDLTSLDPELFSNLFKLTKMSEQEVSELDLDFTINEKVGEHHFTFDLMRQGGADIKIDTTNRLNYIHQLANFKLNTCINIQSKAFLEGMHEIISSSWLEMFDFKELQMLISGSEYQINLEDWKSNVCYSEYSENDDTIKYFWEIVEEMTTEEKSKLLKFVTSVSRPPLLGFKALNPKFGIRYTNDKNRLPTAATCFNLLKLPDYRDKEVTRSKVLYAINMGAGFDLS